MKLQHETLLSELHELTLRNIKFAEQFRTLSNEELNWRPHEKSWNVLECLAHVNYYGDYYIPEIERQMEKSETLPAATFKPGLLGNYFAKIMYPKEKPNPMPTLKATNTLNANLDTNAIIKFIDQQQQTLTLLDVAKGKNLNKIKTGISISKFVRIRLGDTFRVFIYHNYRHILQAERVLNAYRQV